MAWYAVLAQVEHKIKDGWQGSRQIPLFYLSSRAQGIASEEHAARIGRDIVSGAGLFDDTGITFHVTVTLADPVPFPEG
jgi:hypothetical protein